MVGDVLHNYNPFASMRVFQWQSEVTKQVNVTTKLVLCTLSKSQCLPHHSLVLATLPESLKGLGLYTPHCSAVASMVSTYLRNVFSDWHTSTLPLFAMYRDLMTKA
eukprot:12853089-Ditylum_brightwellii.AAC.1